MLTLVSQNMLIPRPTVGWSKTLLAAGIELCCRRKSTIATTITSGHVWHTFVWVDIMLQHSFIT
jgi:hypothetical protein